MQSPACVNFVGCVSVANRNVGVNLNQKYQQTKQFIVRQLPAVVFFYCLVQPLLDVAGYWQTELGIPNVVTMLLRMGLLCASVGLGFVLSDRKRYYLMAALVLGGFFIARTLVCMQVGFVEFYADFMNLARIYLMPLTTLCFCTFVKENPRVIRAMVAGFAANLGIIIAVQVLSRLTGTDPYTYTNKSIGVRGWFLYANTQSAIVSMIVPVAIGWALDRWQEKVLPVAVVTALGLGSLYALGTRLSTAALVAAGVGMAICLLLIDRKRWRQSVAIGCVSLVFLLLLPVSPMADNLRTQAGNFEQRQERFDETVAQAGPDASPEEQQEALVEAYRLFIPGVVSRFGGQRTLEAYNYSTDVDYVANRRIMRLTFCKLLLEDSPESAKWFGMDVSRMRVEGEDLNWSTGEVEHMVTSFDPENDFHAIYYLCGGVGLVLMLLFLGSFALRALFAMARDFKRHFTVDFAALAICCCCAVAHCAFTASTLRHNSASVYLAMALAALWQMSRRELSAKRMHQ